MRTESRTFLTLLLPALLVLPSVSRAASVDSLQKDLPTIFEKNMGQAPSRYQFVSRHGSVEALFSRTRVDLTLPNGSGHRIQISFKLLGNRAGLVPESGDPLPSVSNYLIGNDPTRWIRGVPNNAQVIYREIYPGIDLVFHEAGDGMEHDFRVAANGNPDQIRFSFEGQDQIALDSAGNLDLSLANGKLTFKKPAAYQESSRGREAVESAFVLNADGSVRFHVGAYDRKRELIIDPVFVFSTYLAGSSLDTPAAAPIRLGTFTLRDTQIPRTSRSRMALKQRSTALPTASCPNWILPATLCFIPLISEDLRGTTETRSPWIPTGTSSSRPLPVPTTFLMPELFLP